MKKFKHLALLLLVAVVVFGCSKYDDTELRNDVSDLQSRVEKLETWCATTNTQISALQGLVSALEGNDYVTGVTPVMEGAKEVGYTITFTKSKPITILHGKNGTNGTNGKDGVDGTDGKDGITPIISVAKDTDGNYYWTVKIGDAAAVWMTDVSGNKIRTTGDKGDPGQAGTPGTDGEDGQPGTPGADGEDGHSPILSVAEFEGRLYWKIDGNWLLNGGNKVPATGDKGETGATGSAGAQGDAIFAKDGIDYTTDSENVIFTLADGVTKITLPKSSSINIGFDSYEVFMGTATNNEIILKLPSTLKETDYTAIIATVINESGTGMDVATRSAATEATWGVKVTKPTFGSDGKPIAGSAKVALTAPATIKFSETAMLKVTITDAKGKEFSVARPVKYFDGQIVECTAGNLSNVVTNTQVAKLAIKGSIDQNDFTFIKTLTALKVLDLSMTDLTSIPNRGLAFYSSPNTVLKRVILPQTVKVIDEAAFANCQALETFDIENTETLGQWAFENCYKLRSIKLGNKLTAINNSAFRYCTALTSIDIPASVRSLGRWVFNFCDILETITLHEGLLSLSSSTFYGCGVVSIRIPSTVTEIPDYAFQECKKLERITLHDGITELGVATFLRCYSLRSIKIPAGVTVLKNNLFDECHVLKRVTLHDGITEMQERAFAYCLSLAGDPVDGGLKLPASLATLGEGVFINCTDLLMVDMSATNVQAIPNHFLAQCKNLNSVMLPSGLQTIGEWAFQETGLIGIDLPASVTSIVNYAFWECKNLKLVISRALTAPTISQFVFDPDFKSIRELSKPSSADYTSWSTYFNKTSTM